jgi:DHA1 family multidrug resistance protein-like MFS transporter
MLNSSPQRIYAAIYPTAFLYALGYGVSVYLIPLYATALHANYYELGLIGMVGSILYTLSFSAGWLSDKVNKAYLLAAGLALNSLATALISLTNTVSELLIVRVIGGLALVFYWPVIEALVADISPGLTRVSKIGSYAAATTIGMVVGPPIGGVLAQSLGFKATFLLASLPMVAALALILLYVAPAYGKVVQIVDFSSPQKSSFLKNVVRVAPLVVMYSAFFSTVVSILPGYLSLLGYTASQIGVLFALANGARIVALLSSHRVGGREVLALTFFSLTLALSCIAIFLAESLLLFAVGLVAMGVSIGFIFPLSFTLALKGVEQRVLGRGVGVYESILGVGFAIGPIFSGFVAENIDPKAPYLILGLLCLLTPISLRKRGLSSG